MIIKELFALLGIKVDKKSIGDAEAMMDKAFSIVAGVAQKAALATAASAAALGLITNEAAKAGRETKLWAERTGLSAKELTGLDFAATKVLGRVEDLREGLTILAKKSLEAALDEKGTGSAALAFQKLGVSVQDAAGKMKAPSKLLNEVADGLAGIKDKGGATAIAMQLMEEKGRALIPLLAMGSKNLRALTDEAEALGLTLNDAQVAEGNKLAGSLSVLNLMGQRLIQTIGIDLSPDIRSLIADLMSWYKANRQLIASRVVEYFRLFIVVLRIGFRIFSQVFVVAERLIDAFGGLRRVLLAVSAAAGFLFVISLGQGLNMLAKFTGGVRLLTIANLRAGASALLSGIRFLAMAVILGLVADDIRAFYEGEDSVLGRLIAAFDKFAKMEIDFDKHPMLRLLQMIARAADVAATALGRVAAGSPISIFSAEERRALEGRPEHRSLGGQRFQTTQLVPAPAVPPSGPGPEQGNGSIIMERVYLPGATDDTSLHREARKAAIGRRPGRIVR